MIELGTVLSGLAYDLGTKEYIWYVGNNGMFMGPRFILLPPVYQRDISIVSFVLCKSLMQLTEIHMGIRVGARYHVGMNLQAHI